MQYEAIHNIAGQLLANSSRNVNNIFTLVNNRDVKLAVEVFSKLLTMNNDGSYNDLIIIIYLL